MMNKIVGWLRNKGNELLHLAYQMDAEKKEGRTYFYQYVRDKKRRRVGIVLCMIDTGKIFWSRVHKPLDKFDREIGLSVALNRVEGVNYQIPDDVRYVMDIVENRWNRYRSNFGKSPANAAQNS